MAMVLEICVDSVESAIASQKGGAQRIELCSDLTEGGITPSTGLIESVKKFADLEVFVMIRPRGGDAFYSQYEYDAMKYDVIQANQLGADGVVLGLLDQDARVDVARTQALVELASPMQVTFHRAFDMSANLEDSLARVIETGAHRILTSGGKPSIIQGADRVASLLHVAKGRVRMMVAGGLRQKNIGIVAFRTKANEFHCSLRTRLNSPMRFRNQDIQLGTVELDEFARFVVLEEDVRGLRQALDRIADGVLTDVSRE